MMTNNINKVSDKVRKATMERAKELTSGSELDFPTFLKSMNPSNITEGFWLALPNDFCTKNLSKKDEIITLKDKRGNEYEAKYLAESRTLSNGWKSFARDHYLNDGDVLCFRLIQPLVFEGKNNESEINEGLS
ncbi:hypothetical protein F8388_011615 [Cannabis sativa]|uniref:TF-B3 domain-containing protein n=1 Tax=Cannabis sativa TaxID=3483 RepID=A0A7J6GWZ9_CANSA|nr:hypothetical protein F8388_011615 [Cannabis sativa]